MEMIGGYRLVRTLGAGSRSEVFLGSPTARPDHPPVAVKRFRRTTSDDDIVREIATLSRASSPHLLRLADVALDDSGRNALVFPLLSPESIAKMLARRTRLAPGEVVTIAAPTIAAVAVLHDAGASHGRIGPRTIALDEFGAPVVISFGHGAPIAHGRGERTPSDAARASDPGARLDLGALEELVRGLLVLTPGNGGSLLDWLDRSPSTTGEPTEWLRSLEARVFDIADAVPVEVPPVESVRASSIPIRIDSSPAPERWPFPPGGFSSVRGAFLVGGPLPATPLLAPTADRAGTGVVRDAGAFPTRESRRPAWTRRTTWRRRTTRSDRDRIGRGVHREARRRRTDSPDPRGGSDSLLLAADRSRLDHGRQASVGAPGESPEPLPHWISPHVARMYALLTRRSVWVGIGTTAVLLLGALMLIPTATAHSGAGDRAPRGGVGESVPGGKPGGEPDGEPEIDGAQTAGTAAAGASEVEVSEVEVPEVGLSEAEAEAGAAEAEVSEAGERAIRSDDVVAAASALLAVREACRGSTDVIGCSRGWAAPDTSGSGVPAGTAEVFAGTMNLTAIVPVDRWGGLALLSVPGGDPGAPAASLLIVRGEDGWRIRSLGVAVSRG